ncbi:hypothetical protein BGZ81_010910 [Podila clonocystis]|nr:hypothetical protein BGZ81_010910 [Podila clonocystis]
MILDRLYRNTADHDISLMFTSTSSANGATFSLCFDSEFFVEGGLDEIRIQIKDVEPKTFQVLVLFMYTGYIPQDEQPANVSDGESSWKAVFLSAHLYELEELCQMAQRHIVAMITPDEDIPLLFLSEYIHHELRAALVKYIALTSAPVIAGSSSVTNTLTSQSLGC